jgi:hypothetical protein
MNQLVPIASPALPTLTARRVPDPVLLSVLSCPFYGVTRRPAQFCK